MTTTASWSHRIVAAIMDTKLDEGLKWLSVSMPIEQLQEMALEDKVLSDYIHSGEYTAMAHEFDLHPDGQVRHFWRRFATFLMGFTNEDLLGRVRKLSEAHATLFDEHVEWREHMLNDARDVVKAICAA